jgi:glucan 1,3-beta-glucosidase
MVSARSYQCTITTAVNKSRPTIGSDQDPSFVRDLAVVQAAATLYAPQIHAITVGSESLYRGDMTASQLVGLINITRALLPDFKIGTGDAFDTILDGTADLVIKVCDIV